MRIKEDARRNDLPTGRGASEPDFCCGRKQKAPFPTMEFRLGCFCGTRQRMPFSENLFLVGHIMRTRTRHIIGHRPVSAFDMQLSYARWHVSYLSSDNEARDTILATRLSALLAVQRQ